MTRRRTEPARGTTTPPRVASLVALLLCGASCGASSAGGDGAAHAGDPSSTQRASHPGSPPHQHDFAAPAHGDGSTDQHQHHGPLGHRFENAEEWAARWEGPDRDAWQKPDQVVALMNIAPGMTVADLGTGTGYFVPHLSRAAGADGTVLALDIEASMVAHVAERAARDGLANVRASKVAFDDPGLAPASVHRILCVNTWHHIPDRIAYARKLRDGLVEGGALYIVDFTLEGDHGPPRQARIAPEAAISELRAAGFDAEIVPSSLGEQYVVRGTR